MRRPFSAVAPVVVALVAAGAAGCDAPPRAGSSRGTPTASAAGQPRPDPSSSAAGGGPLSKLARQDPRILGVNVQNLSDEVSVSTCSRSLGITMGGNPAEVKAVYFRCESDLSNGPSPARLLPGGASAADALAAALSGPTAAEERAGFAGEGWSMKPVPVVVEVVNGVAVVDILGSLPSTLTDDQSGVAFLWANASSATGHTRVSILVEHQPLCLFWEGC